MNLETVIDKTEGTVPYLRAGGRRIGTVPGGQAAIDKDRIKKAFSRQAPLYEENAPLQKEVAVKLISILSPSASRLSPAPRVLDLGIGTGFAAKEFALRFPKAGIFGCDIAWGMLAEAKKTRAQLTGADVESLPYKDSAFELVFSSLAFQWTDLNRSLTEAGRILKPHGNLYFATFGEKTLKELIDSYASAWQSMGMEGIPNTMKFESPQRIKTLMEISGFKNVGVKTDPMINRYQSPEALLRSLKAIGAGSPSKELHPSRALLEETFRIYEGGYGTKEGIPATFEVVYAWGAKI